LEKEYETGNERGKGKPLHRKGKGKKESKQDLFLGPERGDQALLAITKN